jgi:hypothetical protein
MRPDCDKHQRASGQMPIDRELMHAHPEHAEAFLDSRNGTMLHEAGHYVSANIVGILSGHLITSAKSERAAAAFVFDDRSAAASRYILSELRWFRRPAFWLNITSADKRGLRVRATISQHINRCLAFTPPKWLSRAGNATTSSHCRTARLHREEFRSVRSLLRQQQVPHVIPSCMLRSPRWRGLRAWFDEAVWTYPMNARRRALGEFLIADANSRSVAIHIA